MLSYNIGYNMISHLLAEITDGKHYDQQFPLGIQWTNVILCSQFVFFLRTGLVKEPKANYGSFLFLSLN